MSQAGVAVPAQETLQTGRAGSVEVPGTNEPAPARHPASRQNKTFSSTRKHPVAPRQARDERAQEGRSGRPSLSQPVREEAGWSDTQGLRALERPSEHVDRCCENVLKAALLVTLMSPAKLPTGPAPSSSGPNCPCRLCVSIKTTEPAIFSNRNHQ